MKNNKKVSYLLNEYEVAELLKSNLSLNLESYYKPNLISIIKHLIKENKRLKGKIEVLEKEKYRKILEEFRKERENSHFREE